MAHPVAEFTECQGCGLVLRAASVEDPDPRHWNECPECGETDFDFTAD